MKSLVSILIPAYNAEKWIEDSIQSAINQSWSDKEIIVVDDGSSDYTFQIARRFESNFLKVVRQNNSGASAARNKALSIAQGDFIQWLDADDILDPNKISIQMEKWEIEKDPKVLISGAWGQYRDYYQNASFERTGLWEDLDPAEWLLRKIRDNLWMAIESWLVTREMTRLAGPWNEALSLDDDGEYFCRIVSNSKRIAFTPEALSYIRRGSLSLSHGLTLSDGKLASLAYSLETYVIKMIELEDSYRTRQACLQLLQRWSLYFYPDKPTLYSNLQNIASRVGATLEPPSLREKYRWIATLFGWKAGKRAQLLLPGLKDIIIATVKRSMNTNKKF